MCHVWQETVAGLQALLKEALKAGLRDLRGLEHHRASQCFANGFANGILSMGFCGGCQRWSGKRVPGDEFGEGGEGGFSSVLRALPRFVPGLPIHRHSSSRQDISEAVASLDKRVSGSTSGSGCWWSGMSGMSGMS